MCVCVQCMYVHVSALYSENPHVTSTFQDLVIIDTDKMLNIHILIFIITVTVLHTLVAVNTQH